MAFKLRDLKQQQSFNVYFVKQLEKEFGDEYKKYEAEFDRYYDKTWLHQVETQSSDGNGKWAGAGPVDYNEAKVLYTFIRVRKPKKVLEVGFASGCSSAVIAKALDKNGKGKLDTVDFKSDPSHKWIIDDFKKYIKKGIINPIHPKDGVEYIEENKDIQYDFIFIDGSHEKDFCEPIAQKLREYYPNILVLYHEWSFSPRSDELARNFISVKENFKHQTFYEREAFEDAYSSLEYDHYGFYGSCGLGVVKKKENPINMKVYYRLSNLEAGIPKKKIPNATKQHCLENCIKEFGNENITIVGDRLNDETKSYVKSLNLRLVEVDNGSGAGTFRDAYNLAIEENDDDQIVYLLEDDFLHKPGSKDLLIEGVLTWPNNYISGYDHPDKYLNRENGGNPYIEDGGEVTRVTKSKSCHWKITNSTVMTFAAYVSRLRTDKDLLMKHSKGNITDSFRFFMELAQTKKVGVLTPIPGFSTHCETAWLTPFGDWKNV